MTVPAYTVYSSHPRLFFRDTDKAAIAARVADVNGWKALYDATIKPAATAYKGYSNSALVNTNGAQNRLMVLLLVGWLEETGRPDGGYRDRAIEAAIYLCSLSDDLQPPLRHRLLALAEVYDVCYDYLTSTEKNVLAGEIIQQCDRVGTPDTEYMDGHAAGDQMCSMAGALALYGHDSRAAARLTEALTFWYGTGSADGPDSGAWAFFRWMHGDGASDKGSWYTILGDWNMLLFSWMLWKATTNLDPFTSEVAWMKKMWQWNIWSGWTGSVDHDLDALGDVAKLSGTYFHFVQRQVYAILADRFPNNDSLEGGYMMRWLFERWDDLDTPYADSCVWQIIHMDRAALTERHPKDATTVPAQSRLFYPPGIYYGRWAPAAQADWDYDQSCVIRISACKWYYLGHQHQVAGAAMIHFKGDRILQSPAGIYSDYGDSHHMNAYQRSWLSSLVPLVHDPAATYLRYGTVTANDGGQQWKKSPTDNRSDPLRLYWMLNDGGGEHWLRTRTFTKPLDDAPTTMTFLCADIEPGYRKKSTDEARCTTLETKYLIIWPSATNGLTWPAILYYARIVKADSSWRTQIPLHSYNAFTATAYGAHTTGYHGLGKLWVDIRNAAAYTKLIVTPGTPLDGNGYGPDQFRIHGDGDDNWKPARSANTRELPDLCRHSMYVEKTTKVTQEDYVMLLMISAIGDSEPVPARSWLADDPDWYGITLGADTYRVHKTQELAVHGSPDSTPPGEVTDLGLAARSGALLSTWTDPVDADFDHCLVYRRTSAIP